MASTDQGADMPIRPKKVPQQLYKQDESFHPTPMIASNPKAGWANVAPNGKLPSCTQNMDEDNLLITDLTPEKLKTHRKSLRAKVASCNSSCYSNCAFDGAYYRKHPVEFLKTLLGG
jgi:hypothetical protein